ncbi:MAG: hypothetical protein K6G27_11195 [Lachnospiraceae bacterium]|nr:hypothetical protein [Lachnospiraceae bacterium]
MGMTEIQRKLRFMTLGAEQYESMLRKDFRKNYIDQYCKNMKIDPRRVKNEDPEYYELILSKAAEATEKMWDEEKKLIAKWIEQDRKIVESVRMGM